MSTFLQHYHFSVDDVLDCLLSLTPNTRSLSECELINYFRELHNEFGAQVDFYTFLQHPQHAATRRQPNGQSNGDDAKPSPTSLTDLPASLAPLFRKLPWLRLGPHALDRDTPPHAQSLKDQANFLEDTYREIVRFASSNSVSPWVRLHYFSECYEQAPVLNRFGTRGLFTTDKPAISYRLPNPQVEQLRKQGRTSYNELDFMRSHVRVENLADHTLTDRALWAELEGLTDHAECAVIFTHEYELVRPEVREMTKRIFRWLTQKNVIPLVHT